MLGEVLFAYGNDWIGEGREHPERPAMNAYQRFVICFREGAPSEAKTSCKGEQMKMVASIMKKFAYTLVWLGNSPQGKCLHRALELLLVVALGTACAFAQAAVEYGGATSGIAGSMSRMNIMKDAKFPSTSKSNANVIMNKASGQKGSKFIDDTMLDGSVEANRHALEDKAGKDAAKLMLRSVPSDAYVRLDGKIVGRTPLLLVVPPHQYKLTMDGTRMEHAERDVDLLPHETREYSLTLKPRYPTQVQVQLH
jgi:PEGA domain